MSRPSWRMGGGKMEIELDCGRGRSVGSHIRLKGRAFGISFGMDEIVTERNPPRRKVWKTTDSPKLLVIGHYRMGFEIAPSESASTLRVFIDYAFAGQTARALVRTFICSTVRGMVHEPDGRGRPKSLRGRMIME
jgi:hypothetical protein